MFGKNSYIKLINQIIDAGLVPSTDWAEQMGSDDFYLRHDVDFSVSAALKIAEIDHSLGVESTFFFMLSSNFYNLMSNNNLDKVRKIRDLKHKISLHWDPTAYKEEKPFLTEKKVFEELFNVSTDIVSVHRPGDFMKDNDRQLFGVAHTYQNRFFKYMSYISDSAGTEVQIKVGQYLENRNKNGLQLLLHPIWWTDELNSPTSTLNKWLLKNTNFIRSELRTNCKTYKP